MLRISLLLSIFLFCSSCDSKFLQDAAALLEDAPLTNADVASGLKEALQFGVDNSVNTLSIQDGFYNSIYKIAMPEDAQKVINALKIIPGFDNIETEIVKRVNRAAEDAAKKAGPIFLDAVRGITFNDAMNILMGDKNAATQYLHNRTYQALYNEFSPVIENSLNKFGALDYWADAVNKYNTLPFVKDLNPDIKDHVTTKSLGGLFSLIEKKEAGIRSDVTQRTTSLLQRVFKEQDKG